MKQILTVFILTLIILSCDSIQRVEDSSVLHSENLIAYIENPSQRGGNGLLWGNIVILDIDTQEKYYLKENESYINNPVWLPYDKKLMYFTETEAYTDSDFPFGFKLGVDLFLFDTKQQTNQILFPNFEKINQKFYMMTHKINGTNESNAFIIPQIRNVYKIKTPNYEITKLIELDSIYHISNINLSPNGNFLILNVSSSSINNSYERNELLLYSIKENSLKKISTVYVACKGGWDKASENYVFCDWDNFLNYNLVTNSIDTLAIPVKTGQNIAYTKNSRIIGFAQKEEGDFKPDEVFIFNPKDKKLIWLTNDKIFKEKLSVLL